MDAVFFCLKEVKMDQNDEKTQIVAANPLVESSVEKMIQVIRGKQVLLDRDIATLYGVETRAINQAVKRNAERFPERYCFQLTREEQENLKSQNVISSWGGDRFKPYVFTEQGFAMLSAVLKSKVAVNVSIAIMDAFVAMRQYLYQNSGIVKRLSNIEIKDLEQDARLLEHDHKINTLFEAMDREELKSKGLFYNNQEFDAYVFVCALIRQAKKRIVLVDRYVDEKTLAMMLKREKGVSVTIYTYDKSKVLEVDLATYNEQYPDSPMQVLPSYGMHDRFLFIDDTAYHFGASLKDLGKNTFFFTQEDFTLDEVLKESQKIQEALENQNQDTAS